MHFDGSDDPLDVAASQQSANKGKSTNDIAPPKLKKNNKGGKREVFVGQLQKWGRGSTKSNKREKDSILRMMRKRLMTTTILWGFCRRQYQHRMSV